MLLIGKIKNNLSAIIVGMLLISLVSPIIYTSKVFAVGEAINGGAAVSGLRGTPIALNDLSITASGNPTLPVRIKVPSGELAMSSTTGLTFTGDPTGSDLAFSGTKNDINAALTSMVLFTIVTVEAA